MKLSLILATISRTSEIGRCLRSLATQTDANFEVLLVDQNQDDRLLPFVLEALGLGINVTHLRMAVPSLSGARNLGISKASGDIIGLTDDDCWYDEDAIAQIRAAFINDTELDGVVGHWVEQAEARATGQAIGLLSQTAWRNFRGGDASSITLFFKRNLLLRLGGFDEHFGIGQWFGAGEETDFVLRALASNARLLNLPSARVHHHFSTGLVPISAANCRNARKRGRGTGAIYAKHALDVAVVLRGFFAPVVRPMLRCNFRTAYLGIFISLGRFEGFIRWKKKQAFE